MKLLLAPMNTDGSLARLMPRFPFILDEQSQPISPYHEYLVFKLLEDEAPLHPTTGKRYGLALLGFARYLKTEGITWDQEADADVAPVLRYRAWQVATCQRHGASVASKLFVVCDMYRWALEARRIRRLTFDPSTVITGMLNLTRTGFQPRGST